jgi:hypothetical protein
MGSTEREYNNHNDEIILFVSIFNDQPTFIDSLLIK